MRSLGVGVTVFLFFGSALVLGGIWSWILGAVKKGYLGIGLGGVVGLGLSFLGTVYIFLFCIFFPYPNSMRIANDHHLEFNWVCIRNGFVIGILIVLFLGVFESGFLILGVLVLICIFGGCLVVWCLGNVWVRRGISTLPPKIKHRLEVMLWSKSLKSIPKEVVVDCIIPYCNAIVSIDLNRMTRTDVIKAVYGRGTGNLWVLCFRRLGIFYDLDSPASYSETLKLYSIPFQQITYVHMCSKLRRDIVFTLNRALVRAHDLRELQMPPFYYSFRSLHYHWLANAIPQHCLMNLGTVTINESDSIGGFIDPTRTGMQLIAFRSQYRYNGRPTMYGTVLIDYFLHCEDGAPIEFVIKYPLRLMATTSALQKESLTSHRDRFSYEKLFEKIGYPKTIVFENWIPLPNETEYCDEFGIEYRYNASKYVSSWTGTLLRFLTSV